MMNVAKIKIDHAEVRSLSRTYDEGQSQIEEMLQRLDATQASLADIWEGQAFSEFDNTFQTFKPKVREFGEFLGSVANKLRENARIMEETDLQLQQANKLK
jgi:WXG100 family type VII secretion target